MMSVITVNVRQNSNGLWRTTDAPENVTKLLMPFPMKVQMQMNVNASKDINGTHQLVISYATEPLMME